MAKISKKRANYSAGLPRAHCGLCEHFRRPAACEIVAGKIEPQMWCRYFRRKPEK